MRFGYTTESPVTWVVAFDKASERACFSSILTKARSRCTIQSDEDSRVLTLINRLREEHQRFCDLTLDARIIERG